MKTDTPKTDHELLIRIDERMRWFGNVISDMPKNYVSTEEFHPFKTGFIHRKEFDLELKSASDAREDLRKSIDKMYKQNEKNIRGLQFVIVGAVIAQIILKFFQ